MGGDYCSQTAACPPGSNRLGQSSDCLQCCKTVPDPAPEPIECPVSSASVTDFRNIIKPHSGQQINTDPVACGPDLVALLKNCGSVCCPLSAEKGNAVCESALLGPLTYCEVKADGSCDENVRDDVGVKLVQVFQGDTFVQKVASGKGRIRVCGEKDGRSCEELDVEAKVPACQLYTPPPGVQPQGCVVPH